MKQHIEKRTSGFTPTPCLPQFFSGTHRFFLKYYTHSTSFIREQKNQKTATARDMVSGFTLIELLVVIAIIGLLSSVVFASLNSARGKARDAQRLADARQIQLALEFAIDSGSGYPAGSGYGSIFSSLITAGFLAGHRTTDSIYGNTWIYFCRGGPDRYAILLRTEKNPSVWCLAANNTAYNCGYTLRCEL